MDAPIFLQNQLLATKFYVPVAPGNLISRHHLFALLDNIFKHPLTLICAPAGFGKTTLLSTWRGVQEARLPLVAWVSLDEEDNEPRLFWVYVLTALNRQQPERFTPLLKYFQSLQAPPLKYMLGMLINLLVERSEHFVLILDDYHLITEPQVHSTLMYLVEHLPAQLRIILATRADPPLSLAQLRARGQILEIRTNQLRCTVAETKAFFEQVLGMSLPDETIQHVTARTEGWLAGLQLLALSLPAGADPIPLLEQASGDQCYILDYLIEEILQQQPQEVQSFLFSTCILERLTASLCDAVTQEQGSSQQMLERLEQANLFVVSLDGRRQWYRYHALFAQALHYQLELTHRELIPILHHRASRWYAQHHQTTKAILHALHARQWQWVADLIESSPPLLSYTWGAGVHELVLLRQWLEQLPADVVRSRPRLCLACIQLLWMVAPQPTLKGWLDAAEATLTASLTRQTSEDVSDQRLTLQERQEQENLLGEVNACRAYIWGYREDGQAALVLCQRALSLLSAENFMVRSLVALGQLQAYYTSSANDAVASVESGLQAGSFAQDAGQPGQAIAMMGVTALFMIGTGQLHETQRLTQHAIQLGMLQGDLVLPEVGWPMIWQAELLREWNQLEAARSLIEEALSLCKQTESINALSYLLYGYSVLLRISVSCADLEAARSALQDFERNGKSMNQLIYLHVRSHFTTIDQVRLWLAGGELDRATRWAKALDLGARYGTLFAREREEVAYARIVLATHQPGVALQRLKPVLERATAGKRRRHVIEIRLLQALAHQMLQEMPQALAALSEALHLAEPEGYIRSFVDEGTPVVALLSRLREEQRQHGPTPYLDTLLAAFPQPSKTCECQPKQVSERTKPQPLLDPLSEREGEVLQVLACGASNQEIAQELVITVETVKSHVSQILSKLGVKNRLQAVRKAQELRLLDGER